MFSNIVTTKLNGEGKHIQIEQTKNWTPPHYWYTLEVESHWPMALCHLPTPTNQWGTRHKLKTNDRLLTEKANEKLPVSVNSNLPVLNT